MGRRHWVVAGAAVAWLAAAMAAQTPGAAFFAGPGTRGAMLNGHPLLAGTAVLPGETVTTGNGGVVVLTPTGSSGGAIELTGDAAATVAAPTPGQTGAPLAIAHGDALIYGRVNIVTPQGATLLPISSTTSYVVNIAPVQSSLGVLTGSVHTLHTSGDVTVPKGEARSWNAGGQMSTVQLTQLKQPQPDSSMPKLTPASVSR